MLFNNRSIRVYGPDTFNHSVYTGHMMFGIEVEHEEAQPLKECLEMLQGGKLRGVHCFQERDTLCQAKEKCQGE